MHSAYFTVLHILRFWFLLINRRQFCYLFNRPIFTKLIKVRSDPQRRTFEDCCRL